jgi:integrase
VTIFAKGGKVREIPIVDPDILFYLERHILDWGARPTDYLMCRRKSVPHKRGSGRGQRIDMDVVEYRDTPMGDHGVHDWWYTCLQLAGLVPAGTTRGERLHKTRHTAGQRMLDSTKGNLKAVQALLGHADIRTTADVYVDWDIHALETSMRETLDGESFPP